MEVEPAQSALTEHLITVAVPANLADRILTIELRPGESPAVSTARVDCLHSEDFRSVRWGDQRYSFTASQAACVRVLWRDYMQETPDIGAAELLELAGLRRSSRLQDIFRGHDCWGVFIVPGATKGTVRLADPNKAPNTTAATTGSAQNCSGDRS